MTAATITTTATATITMTTGTSYVFLSSNMLTYARGRKIKRWRLAVNAHVEAWEDCLLSLSGKSSFFFLTNDYIQSDLYGTGTGTTMTR